MSFLALLAASWAVSVVQAYAVEPLTREQLNEETQKINHKLNTLTEQLAILETALKPRVRTCPDTWLRFNTSCYGVGSEALSWAEAQEVCGRFGAGLAEVNSAAENDFIKDISRTRGYQGTWLGATDIFSDGHWVWVDSGRPLSSGFTDWYPGQPGNDGRSQDCLTNWKDHPDYRWGDLQCEYAMPFVCEMRRI